MVVTYLAIGSNLGNRELYLRNAKLGLQERGIVVVRSASIYETEPKDFPDQPWFLNTVLEARTEFSAQQLLEACLSIERQNQRVRSLPKSARTLDMDIVFYGTSVIREPGLTIPHPRYTERNFVLVPLAEIAPMFVDPESGATMEELRGRSPDSAVVRKVSSGEQFSQALIQ